MLASQKQFQIQLEQLAKKLQRGQAQSAILDIQSLPTNVQQHPNVQHLYAIAMKNVGEIQQALTIMHALVKRYPQQAEFHNNLANLLKEQGKEESAIKHYKAALSINPNYLDAFKNMLILNIDSSELNAAKSLLEQYRHAFEKSLVFQKFEADYFLATKDYTLAQEKYQQVLQQQANYKEAKIGLSKVFIQQNKYADALQLLQEVLANGPSALAHYQMGIAFFELNEYAKSEGSFKQAIELNIGFIAAHVQLNEMLWQLGQIEQFGQSFISALDKQPQLSPLRGAYVSMLINAEYFEQAMDQVHKGLSMQPDQANLLFYKGLLLANNNELKDAFNIMRGIWQESKSFDSGIELIKLSIKLSRYDNALQVIDELQREHPNHQLLLAYKATCFKLTDPEKYKEFTQIEVSVRAFKLPTPAGYETLNDFLYEVKNVLVSMHKTSTRPLQQTLRKGTQTPGRLLDREHPVLSKLKWAYENTISKYIATLPNDPEHVFFKRKSSSFKITGSWSVMLNDSGFHVNHVHPEGWISSACYISLPDSINDEEGSIRFGQSPLELGNTDMPDLIITPQEGLLVLFPSFIWHGTLPFHSSEMRLTAPFDVVPIEVFADNERKVEL